MRGCPQIVVGWHGDANPKFWWVQYPPPGGVCKKATGGGRCVSATVLRRATVLR